MNNLCNFERYGYCLLEKLNQSTHEGQITYKGIELSTQIPVLIKQYPLPLHQDKGVYQQVKREIKILQRLNHLGIPRYLQSFEPGDGICFVQEHKNAKNLSCSRIFGLEEVKDIAIQLLEIIIYLQTRIPAIIHQDIKPENILIDSQGQIYLVGFGSARIESHPDPSIGLEADKARLISPEQLSSQSLKKSSDLYGLGKTLICLLAGIKSAEFEELIDADGQINFQTLLIKQPTMPPFFVNWLEKMVALEESQGFENAQKALDFLIFKEDFSRISEIRLDHRKPDITNRNDRYRRAKFELRKSLDTQEKGRQKNRRTIVVKNHARSKYYHLKVMVKTVSLPTTTKKPLYGIFGILLIATTLWGGLILPTQGAVSVAILGGLYGVISESLLGMFLGIISGAASGVTSVAISTAISVAIFMGISGGISGAISVAISVAISKAILVGAISGAILVGSFTAILGGISWVIYFGAYWAIGQIKKGGFNNVTAAVYCLLTCICGTSIGWLMSSGVNVFALLGLIVSGFPLCRLLIYPLIKQLKLMNNILLSLNNS